MCENPTPQSVPNETYYSADFEDEEEVDHSFEETDIDVTNEKEKDEMGVDQSSENHEINQK